MFLNLATKFIPYPLGRGRLVAEIWRPGGGAEAQISTRFDAQMIWVGVKTGVKKENGQPHMMSH